MQARVSTYSGDTERMREGFASVTEDLERLDGFVQAFFLTDAKSSRGISITLWESREALEATAERANEMRKQATGQMGGSIDSVESYDVVLTVQGAASRR